MTKTTGITPQPTQPQEVSASARGDVLANEVLAWTLSHDLRPVVRACVAVSRQMKWTDLKPDLQKQLLQKVRAKMQSHPWITEQVKMLRMWTHRTWSWMALTRTLTLMATWAVLENYCHPTE